MKLGETLNLLSVNEHANCLMRVLHAIEFEEISEDNTSIITDWLNMAAGVERVQIIAERYDSSIYMCGSALAFSNEKSKLWSNLCTELVAFNFIWGSLEALALKYIVRRNSDSTTYLARKFISKYYKEPVIYGYNDALNNLHRMLGKQLTEIEMLSIDKEPISTKGLFMVSKLRNQFAHGSRIISLPDDWSNELKREVDIIQLSSRIVLYSIQMLLLIKYGSKGYLIEDPKLFDFVELEGPVPLDALIKNVHIGGSSEKKLFE